MYYNGNTRTPVLMKEFGYPKFQQHLFNNISDFICSTIAVDEVNVIKKEYVKPERKIRWLFVGLHKSYEISMHSGSILIVSRERKPNATIERDIASDRDMWELHLFTEDNGCYFDESIFHVCCYARKDDCYSSAKTLLLYATRDYDFINDNTIKTILS